MIVLLLLLALFLQPAPPPPTLVLITPARVAPGEEFRVNAAIFGEGTFDMALRLGMPPGFTTDDPLVQTIHISRGNPAVLWWWVRAGQNEGRYPITMHTLGRYAIVRTVVIGRDRVWLPMVRNNEATPARPCAGVVQVDQKSAPPLGALASGGCRGLQERCLYVFLRVCAFFCLFERTPPPDKHGRLTK